MLLTYDQCSHALIIPWLLLVIIIILHFANEKQLAGLLVNCFVLGKYRDVTKILSCQVKLSRRGIRQLGISFSYIFLLFSYETSLGKIPALPLNDSPGSVPLPSLLPCAHSSAPDIFFSFPIQMPLTHTTLINGELLSIMQKIIFQTAPIMAFCGGQNYTDGKNMLKT